MKKFPNSVLWDKSHKKKTFKGTKGTRLSVFTLGLRLKRHGVYNPYLSYIHFETMRRMLTRIVKPKARRDKRSKFQNTKSNISTRRHIRKSTKHAEKNPIRLRYHFYSPITKKPLQVRMGKGKGSPYNWVYPASSSRVLLELSRKYLSHKKVLKCAKQASRVVPYGTRLFFERRFMRREHRYKSVSKFYHRRSFKKRLKSSV